MAFEIGGDARFTQQQVLIADFTAVYHAFVPTTGISSASLTVTLAKNTIVRRFDVLVTAARAQRTQAITAAQVRAYNTPAGNTAVIDFGVPRTLSAILVTSANIASVSAWNGAAFGNAFYARGTSAHAIFASEVRSERFLVMLSAAIPNLEEEMILELPELPSDLEIRINGGAPVWTNPGAVQPTTAALSTETWDSNAQRIVELGGALNALLADPLAETTAPYEITVTTKVPGKLLIAERERSLSFVNRILFNSDPERVLDFTEEGLIEVPLPLPSSTTALRRRVEEVRLTVIANLAPERVLPAVGPSPASNSQTPVLAELVIDAGHAACVRLDVRNQGEELERLTAIRLPLAAEGDGAEVRVVLWSNGDSGPSEPLPGGVSKPVTLAAAPETWTRFEFAKPVPVDPENPPWAAVLASRGTVSWALANSAAVPAGLQTPDDALLASNVVRRGSPNGPWEALPAPFVQPGGLMIAAGRVRVAGIGAKESPVAPVLMTLSSTWTRVSPTVKGVPLTIPAGTIVDAGTDGPRLLVVSRTAGALTLRDVDVVWRPEPST